MEKIQLQGCQNTRDLGGMKTKDGRKIKKKKLLRSGALYSATESDLHILTEEYDLKAIIDLRTIPEMKGKPDPQIEGVTYYANPVLEEFEDQAGEKVKDMPKKNPLQDAIDRANGLPDDVKEFMKSLYPELVKREHCVQAYKNFFQYLLKQEDGAILWHCSEGKDRVGVGTMLLLTALGVDMEEIKRDYIYTNNCIYEEVTMLLGAVSRLASNRLLEEKIMYMLTVDPEYLESVLDYIEGQYGSVEKFLEEAMELSSDDIKQLRDKYLEA